MRRPDRIQRALINYRRAARWNGNGRPDWSYTVPSGSTPGADKGDDTVGFVLAMREARATPHVAAKKFGLAIDGRMPRVIGLAKVVAQTVFTFVCYNLIRMATLFGWQIFCGIELIPPTDCRMVNTNPRGCQKNG